MQMGTKRINRGEWGSPTRLGCIFGRNDVSLSAGALRLVVDQVGKAGAVGSFFGREDIRERRVIAVGVDRIVLRVLDFRLREQCLVVFIDGLIAFLLPRDI